MKNIYEKDCADCEYCFCKYYERDTGYGEDGCELTGYECRGGFIDSGCPLSFKYEISK